MKDPGGKVLVTNLVNPIVIFLSGEEEGDAEVDGQEEEVRGEGWLQSGGQQEEEEDGGRGDLVRG